MPSLIASKEIEYPLFDWLRFALASVVVVEHAGVGLPKYSGNLAVQVFFALSGYLIGGILLRSPPPELPLFFFNRATRIWIPYFAAVALLYSVSLLKDPITARWLEFLFYDVTFTHNWFTLRPNAHIALAEMPLHGTANHFWSISVEEQFYLVTPLLMLVRSWREPTPWLLGAATFTLFGSTDFTSISLGVFAAAAQSTSNPKLLKIFRLRWVAVGGGLAFAALTHRPLYSSAAPLFAVAVVLLAARSGTRTAIGRFLGGASYPIYLNHWIGVFATNALGRLTPLPDYLWVVIAYIGGVAAGVAAYALIDQPVLSRRALYYSRPRGRTLAVIAYSLLAAGLCGGVLFTP